MIPMKNRNLFAFCITLLTLLPLSACRPVLTVGWGEIAFVVLLILLLLGPPLYRLIRRLAEFRTWRSSSKDK